MALFKVHFKLVSIAHPTGVAWLLLEAVVIGIADIADLEIGDVESAVIDATEIGLAHIDVREPLILW